LFFTRSPYQEDPRPAVAQISFLAANPILEQGNRCFF